MTKNEILYANQLICKFMGFKSSHSNEYDVIMKPNVNEPFTGESFLKFHTHWEWIIPVWNKILSLEKEYFVFDRFEIGKKSIFLLIYPKSSYERMMIFHDCHKDNPDCADMIEVYYRSIIDFIIWFEKINKKPRLTRKEFNKQVKKSKEETPKGGSGYDLNENGGFKK